MCSSFLSPPSSLAYQKLSEALDLIAKAHAEDTPIVERLLYECIEHARQHAEEDDKNSSIILSTASTFMAHLQEAKDDDRRCPRRTLYEQAMRAWPGNPEAAFALASIVKAEARTKEDLSAVEALLRVASGEGENEEDEENAEEEETGKVDDDDQGQRIEDREDEDGGNEEAKPSTQIIAGVVAEDGSSIEGDAEEEEGQQLEKEQDKMSQHYRRQAQEALALLWLQQDGRHPCADALLRRLGFSHRLAAQVLGYALPSMSPCSLPPAATPYLRVYDDVLPLPALGVLQRLFAPSAAFWEDHGYFRREQAYFSYLLPLPPAASRTASSELDVPSPLSIARLNPLSSVSTTATTTCCLLQSTPVSPSSSFSVTATPVWPSRTAIETIIERHLLPLAKHAYPHLFFDASGPLPTLTAEWWAHCRRHAEGHQLHFDSLDEGKGYVRHPLISCVVYLSEIQGLGGPTLVTDQTLTGGRLATQGWLCHGKVNRVCLFEGRHLHGVLPGRGVPPQEGEVEGKEERRRITFMVGFWKGELPARPAAPPQGRRRRKKIKTVGSERGKAATTVAAGEKEEEEEAEEEEDEEERARPRANMSIPAPPFSDEAPCPRWLQAAMEAGKEVEEGVKVGAMTPELATGGLAVLDRIWERVDAGEKEGGREGEGKEEPPPSYQSCFQGF
ncbi:Hypothetical protein NocV09_09200010 [Nannochloropsis oceanica]